ncbi:MAG: four helix bundle protein [Fimbriimonadales bacterium]
MRTKAFALQIADLCDSLPTKRSARIFEDQALRSGASVGAHYREGCRGRSTAEFITKLEVGLQELEETAYWHELIVGGNLAAESQVAPILREANELTSIFVASVVTAKRRANREKEKR